MCRPCQSVSDVSVLRQGTTGRASRDDLASVLSSHHGHGWEWMELHGAALVVLSHRSR